MEFMYLLIFAIFIFILLKLWQGVRKPKEHFEEKGEKYYEVRDSLMNRSEAMFFRILLKHVPDGNHVFPKMRIADILKTIAQGREYYYRRNQILPKHVDFVVCNGSFKPIVAIELNGKSHNSPKRIERDEHVRDIFKNAGLELEFVEVGTNFEAQIKSIMERLS